jgi:hypothetical protein
LTFFLFGRTMSALIRVDWYSGAACSPSKLLIETAEAVRKFLHRALVLDAAAGLFVDKLSGCDHGLAIVNDKVFGIREVLYPYRRNPASLRLALVLDCS